VLNGLPPVETLLVERPLLAIPLVFGAGVLTSLTPCVYPMIPITAGLLGGIGAGGYPWPRRVGLTATYVVGLALVYATLGLVAGLTGSLFGAISSSPWAYFLIGNLLLVFGLGMLRVFTLTPSSGLLGWANRFSPTSYAGVFGMGATSGLVAAPCGAPVFGAVLTFVGATRSALLGFVYLFVFSLGMTALLVVVGLAAGRLAALPRSGQWLEWVKRGAGVLLLAMAEYYFIQMGKVS